MANYFVSNARGDDSTGTGTAINPWKTLSKAIGSSPAITLSGSGDALYIEPGIYRETVALGLSPTSGGPLTIIGDGTGAGFRAGGYATPATGEVEIRAWTDGSTPMTTGEVLAANGKSYVSVRGVKMIGGGGVGTSVSCFNLTGSFSDWSFEDCVFLGSTSRLGVGKIYATAGAALNATFKRCDFVGPVNNSSHYGVQVVSPLNATEYDVNVLFQNCNFFGTAGCIQVAQSGGSGSGWSTGVRAQQCGFYFAFRGFHVNATPTLTTPLSIYGCTFAFVANAIVGTATTGQVVENGNAFAGCVVNRTANVPTGANSIDNACPAINFHDERLYGGVIRPFLEPSAVSPFLGAGAFGSPPTVDLYNRGRPEGGGSLSASCGATERHDTTIVQTGVVQAGAAALQLTGPGSMEWLVPVGATSTSLTIYTQVDANYGTTNPPVFEVDAEPQYGVAYASATASSSTGSWHQIAISSFTPTSAGWVKVRVRAKPDAANGICYIDTFGGATGDPAALATAFRGSVPKFAASTTTTTVVNIFNSEC